MNTSSHSSIVSLLALAATCAAVRAQDPDASRIFESLQPSVVLITDVEGGGSGIVLSEDGMILTNFHVANTPLPQTVEAVVEERGRQVKKTFSKVTLLKVHAQNDLALLTRLPLLDGFRGANR